MKNIMFSVDLATTWWPIPTVVFALLVIFIKSFQDNWKSFSEWWSSAWKASLVFLWGLLFVYAPYARHAQLKATIAQNEGDHLASMNKLETEKNERIQQLEKMIATIRRKENSEIAKRCFHTPLAFTQTRLENFSADTSLEFEFAKEVKLKPFSYSGPTNVRVHHNGHVSWFVTEPRDKEFEKTNGGVHGYDYSEVAISPNVLAEKQWSIFLFGDKPIEVVCVDRLPSKRSGAK